MDAGRDGADKIKERIVSTNEHERGRIDRCAEKAAILLKNLDSPGIREFALLTSCLFWLRFPQARCASLRVALLSINFI